MVRRFGRTRIKRKRSRGGRLRKAGRTSLGQEKKEMEPALCSAVFIICSKETLTWSGSLTGKSGQWWKGGGR